MADDGPSALTRFINGILPENPTYRQMLGMCPTLAVTGNVQAALTMAGSTTFVLVMANIMTSLLRKVIQPHLRILVFTIVIAGFVTVVDRMLAAFLYQMSKELGSFIALIIVNCIIISRCEVCAAKQGVGISIADGFGQGLGFALGLTSIASVREILGAGTWFGLPVLGEAWPDWGVMAMAPGAFFTLGLLMGLVNWIQANPPWVQRLKRCCGRQSKAEG